MASVAAVSPNTGQRTACRIASFWIMKEIRVSGIITASWRSDSKTKDEKDVYRRHRILADPSEHDRIGRRDKREHEVLQSDRESQPEQLPVEHLVAEQLFHIHFCSIPSRLFAFHFPLPTPNPSDTSGGIDVEDTPGNPFVKPKVSQVSTIWHSTVKSCFSESIDAFHTHEPRCRNPIRQTPYFRRLTVPLHRARNESAHVKRYAQPWRTISTD